MASDLAPCPICGARVETLHLAAPWQGIDMGWECGCPKFAYGDGLHNLGPGDDRILIPKAIGYSRAAAEENWRAKAERIKRRLEWNRWRHG